MNPPLPAVHAFAGEVEVFHAGCRLPVFHLHLGAWHWLPCVGREKLEVELFKEWIEKPVAAVLNGELLVVPIELPHLVGWL